MKFRVINYFTCAGRSYYPKEEFTAEDLAKLNMTDKDKLRHVWRGDMEKIVTAEFIPPPVQETEE